MDLHYDWIAVGSGASGLASALWAAHRGLKAIVVEKAPVVGGATAYSYGGLWAPNNALQRAAGLHDSNEQGLEYLRFLSGGFAEEEKMRLYATEAAVTIEAFARTGCSIPNDRGSSRPLLSGRAGFTRSRSHTRSSAAAKECPA